MGFYLTGQTTNAKMQD